MLTLFGVSRPVACSSIVWKTLLVVFLALLATARCSVLYAEDGSQKAGRRSQLMRSEGEPAALVATDPADETLAEGIVPESVAELELEGGEESEEGSEAAQDTQGEDHDDDDDEDEDEVSAFEGIDNIGLHVHILDEAEQVTSVSVFERDSVIAMAERKAKTAGVLIALREGHNDKWCSYRDPKRVYCNASWVGNYEKWRIIRDKQRGHRYYEVNFQTKQGKYCGPFRDPSNETADYYIVQCRHKQFKRSDEFRETMGTTALPPSNIFEPIHPKIPSWDWAVMRSIGSHCYLYTEGPELRCQKGLDRKAQSMISEQVLPKYRKKKSKKSKKRR